MLTDAEIQSQELSRTSEAPAAPARRSGLFTRVDGRTCLLVAAAGVAAYFAMGALEPAAAHPAMESSLWFLALSTAFSAAAFAAGVGLVQRQRFGLVAAMSAAAIELVGVVMCPVSGHHAYGPWWLAQMSIAVAFCAVTASAVGSTRAR